MTNSNSNNGISTLADNFHTAVLHVHRLNRLCRICGRRSTKFRCGRKALLCAPHRDAIWILHDLDISHDTQSQHMQKLLHAVHDALG